MTNDKTNRRLYDTIVTDDDQLGHRAPVPAREAAQRLDAMRRFVTDRKHDSVFTFEEPTTHLTAQSGADREVPR